MTDVNVLVASLPATEGNEAELIARCAGKRVELFVSTATRLRDNETMFRIGESKAQRVRTGRGTTGDSAFVLDPYEWLRRMKDSASETMLVQLGTYSGSGAMLLRFHLTGADAAITQVVERCGGWPKKPRVCNKPWPERCAWEMEAEEP